MNLNFEFESVHELLINLNLNSTFAKSMNLNLNLNLVFSKSMNLNLNLKIKNNIYQPVPSLRGGVGGGRELYPLTAACAPILGY